MLFDDTLQRLPIRKSELDRFKSGKQKYCQIANQLKDHSPLCLDIACGAQPFPKADVLCDLNIKPVKDRSMKKLVTNGKPFVLCSCYNLPFKDNIFDFVTSYYLLEHIAYPGLFLKELKRISKHIFIQCPTWFNELLYGEEVHNWIVLKHNNKLYLRSSKRKDTILNRILHQLYKNKNFQLFHAILDETFHCFSLTYSN